MERAEEEVGNRQEVAGPDAVRVVMQEGGPGLARVSRRPSAPQVLLDGRFGDVDVQLEQFTTDPFSTPRVVGRGHLAHERDGLRCNGWSMRRCGGVTSLGIWPRISP